MQVRVLPLAGIFCSILFPSLLSAEGAVESAPQVILCTGLLPANPEGEFTLDCRAKSLEKAASIREEHIPMAARHTPRNPDVPGCEKPGDVVEQGFCLD